MLITTNFNQAGIIFWNTSNVKNYHSDRFDNANIYLGDEEREYVKNLQSFVKNAPADMKKAPVNINWCGGKAYGLESERQQLIYLFHYTNP